MTDQQLFEVPAPGKAPWLTLVGLSIVLPAVAGIAIWANGQANQDQRVLLGTLAFMVLLTALLALLLQRRSVSLRSGVLEIRAALYTQHLAVSELDLDHARVINLDERTELRPVLRTNGYSLPGFHAGHYRAGIKQRVFCLITDRERVLALPEHGGRVVLLSLKRPQALLDALRKQSVPMQQRREPRASPAHSSAHGARR